MSKDIYHESLVYHEFPSPGKIGTRITKSTENQRDLALAYTPGVAAPVRAIADNPENAYKYTSKGNTVAVITNGTAVLGLGNVGALASKPVMEGKVLLMNRYAGLDGCDIEIDLKDSQTFIDTVSYISPSFGAINLEDIKAPECFEIEKSLIERLNIPVFHDDQHGTAIIIAAGLLNALTLQKKAISEAIVVCVGAGAAGIASMRLLLNLGFKRENIILVDTRGVIHSERQDLNQYKAEFANKTDKRTLADALEGADVFIGVSGPNIMTSEMLLSMAPKPIIFALSNPEPEVDPKLALNLRDDLIIATGRSDYPNQVNNVLCFPYIFRAALDVRASKINKSMMVAAVHAIKDLACEPIHPVVFAAYPSMDKNLSFGAEYILPKPNDPRLKQYVPAAIAQAAIRTGVAGLEYPEHYLNLEFNNSEIVL